MHALRYVKIMRIFYPLNLKKCFRKLSKTSLITHVCCVWSAYLTGLGIRENWEAWPLFTCSSSFMHFANCRLLLLFDKLHINEVTLIKQAYVLVFQGRKMMKANTVHKTEIVLRSRGDRG